MKMKSFLSHPAFHIAAVTAWLAIPAWSSVVTVPMALDSAPHNTSDFNVFAKLAKASVPSVVNLSSTTTVKMQPGPNFDENIFNQFMNPRAFQPRKETALGSGFIIDPSGLILTNNHVVAHTDKVDIQLTESSDDKAIVGKVIGRDPELDVALIRFTPPRKLSALKLGDSDALEVGEFVMAVGNPYGQGHSVSHGIVSAKGRASPDAAFANYLQTDAPINPGNSGGPLLNLNGEVVGINNAIDPRAQGISFAIPINFVKSILPQLEKEGKVSRGFIGAAIAPMTEELAQKMGEAKDLNSPIVSDITLGGPAAKAGVRPYDIITAVSGKAVHTPSELIMAVTSTPVGEKIPLTILRAGKTLTLDVRVEQRPEPERVSQR
jgi:serine protease Do